MPATLYAVPASHPCASVAAMLDAKGVDYRRIELIVAFSRVWLRLLRFPGGTVPALSLDGARCQGSRQIARELDVRFPQPPLFPAAPDARARVEEIEAWGDEVLQEIARRIILWSLLRSRAAVRSTLVGVRLQFRLPTALAVWSAWPILRIDAAINDVSSEAVRRDLAELPATLDRIDGWIAEGVLGTDPPTAADYQLAGSLRLLLAVEDLAPIFASRPAADLARRLIPRLQGHVPAGTLPRDWLPGAAG